MTHMTQTPGYDAGRGRRIRRWASRLGRRVLQRLIAARSRQVLMQLPDSILADIGLPRCGIDHVAERIAAARTEPRADSSAEIVSIGMGLSRQAEPAEAAPAKAA